MAISKLTEKAKGMKDLKSAVATKSVPKDMSNMTGEAKEAYRNKRKDC